jgi:hypothetical protein
MFQKFIIIASHLLIGSPFAFHFERKFLHLFSLLLRFDAIFVDNRLQLVLVTQDLGLDPIKFVDFLLLLDLNVFEISLEDLMCRLPLFFVLFVLELENLKFLIGLVNLLILLKKHIIESVNFVLVETVSLLELSKFGKAGLDLFLN